MSNGFNFTQYLTIQQAQGALRDIARRLREVLDGRPVPDGVKTDEGGRPVDGPGKDERGS